MVATLKCWVASLLFFSTRSFASVVTDYRSLGGKPYKVSFNNRSLLINDQPALLLSGSIHYVRSTPSMWPSIFQKARENNLNTVTSYVFWNAHEHTESSPRKYDYGDDCSLALCGKNATRFLSLAQEAGLFVHWRIGPFIGAEWPRGGIPDWVKGSVRSSDAQWLDAAFGFVEDHLKVIEPFLARNGGPIVGVQIENEYGGGDENYTGFLADFVNKHSVGVPWTMCYPHDLVLGAAKGAFTNNSIVTCNGCDCGRSFPDQLRQVQPQSPLMWTENEQWFEVFGKAKIQRDPANLGQAVARWLAHGAAHHNYYMWHGGNMFGNWSHPLTFGLWHTPAYADDAPMHSDGTPNEPTFSHVGQLHSLALEYAETLLSIVPPEPISLSSKVQCWVYGALAFVENDNPVEATVRVPGSNHDVVVPANGISLIAVRTATLRWSSSVVNVTRQTPLPSPLPLALDWKEDWWPDTQQGGWWRRATFGRPAAGIGSESPLLLNVSGLFVGNAFVNGNHVATFATLVGNCTGGAGECNSFLQSSCGRPTQDVYTVPFEFLDSATGENELLIFNCGTREGHTCSLPAGITPPSTDGVFLASRHLPSKTSSTIDDLQAATLVV